MNIALRKLVMLEKSIAQQEEMAKINGYSTNVVDSEFKERVANLINKVRYI